MQNFSLWQKHLEFENAFQNDNNNFAVIQKKRWVPLRKAVSVKDIKYHRHWG